jgi:hypothetical protein
VHAALEGDRAPAEAPLLAAHRAERDHARRAVGDLGAAARGARDVLDRRMRAGSRHLHEDPDLL